MDEKAIKEALEEEGFQLSYEDKPYLVNPGLLTLSPITKKIESLIAKAENADLLSLFQLSLFIKFLEPFVKENNTEEKKAFALLLEPCSSLKKLTPFGKLSHSKEIKTSSSGIFNYLIGEEKATFYVIKDIIEGEFYGTTRYTPINDSILSVVYAKAGKNLYCWNTKAYYSFSSPLLSLAYALRAFNDKIVGGIIFNNLFFPNPFYFFNYRSYLKVGKEKVDLLIEELKKKRIVKTTDKEILLKLAKLYIFQRYWMIRRNKNALIYFSNFFGNSLKFRNVLNDRLYSFVKTVGIEEELLSSLRKKGYAEGEDYKFYKHIPYLPLSSLCSAFSDKKLLLLYNENSVALREQLSFSPFISFSYSPKRYVIGSRFVESKKAGNALSLTISTSPFRKNSLLDLSLKYYLVSTSKGKTYVLKV